MQRIQTHCEACGAALPPHFTNGIKVCEYCGAIYKDEGWVEPPRQVNTVTPPVLPSTTPEYDIPIPNFDETVYETQSSHNGLRIVVIVVALALLGCMLSLLLSKRGNNHQNLSSFTQNAVKTKPVMLNSLPAASYTGKTIEYADWEIYVDPSIEASNGRISIKITLQNWNSSSQTFRYKANDIILYDDVDNKYPLVMDDCADDAGYLDQQFSFDAFEKDDLSSSSYWCGNQRVLPAFTGTIPGNAKFLYLQLTNFGAFQKITFVYQL